MKLINTITASAIIGISLNFIEPAKANWSKEMYSCQVSFKDSFSKRIAKDNLYVTDHAKLDKIAYEYCEIVLTAVASGDTMSAAIALALQVIQAKYDF